ncbi:hypothetical protein [Aestuariimicrobium ganziense]|uniref:hypothetical protein n=1 Tax=Aestuariimicrobium ganziense TaxID=2773677 RepID=UPI0019416F95|nr:hypothetical protein [Aestuariimicrobium ganziense]
MNRDPLTDLLRTTLSTHADQVPAPDTDDVVDGVLPRGHRVLHRRRAAAGVGVGGVAVALATAGWLTTRGDGTGPTPTIAQSPSTSATSTPTVTERSQAPALTELERWELAQKLPVGRPIHSAWRAERTADWRVRVVLPYWDDPAGSSETPTRDAAGNILVTLPKGTGMVTQIIPTAAGYLVASQSDSFTGGDMDPGATLYLVTRTKAIPLLTGIHGPVAVNPTGERVAAVVIVDERARTFGLVERQLVPLQTHGPAPTPQDDVSLLLWSDEGQWTNSGDNWTFVRGPNGGETIGRKVMKAVQVAPSMVYSVDRQPDGRQCIVVQSGPHDATTLGCGQYVSLLALSNAQAVVTVTDDSDVVSTYLADGYSALESLTVPDAIDPVSLIEAVEEIEVNGAGDTYHVLVPIRHPDDPSRQVFVRWDPVAGTAEQAPLPDGVEQIVG